MGNDEKVRNARGRGEARVKRSFLLAVSFALVWGGLVSGEVGAGERGRCTSAVIAETMWLPDGSPIPGGRLTFCTRGKYSPVDRLQDIRVDGHPMALMVSRREFSESLDDRRPFVMLNRDPTGRLHLIGYAIPGRKRMITYELRNIRLDPAPARPTATASRTATTDGTPVLLALAD